VAILIDTTLRIDFTRAITPGSLDLLIAIVAMRHGAELLTFDTDFEQIARVSARYVTRLLRPS